MEIHYRVHKLQFSPFYNRRSSLVIRDSDDSMSYLELFDSWSFVYPLLLGLITNKTRNLHIT